MWSVQGDTDVNPFYPGDQYVDVVGVTLFGLQQRDKNEVGRNRTFVEMLTPIYRRVAYFKKPIYVAEFGYDGDADYVRAWAEAATHPVPEFSLLEGIVYFNDREVYPWPGGYGQPNWRVMQDALTK
jgi:beta-mannanase